MSHLARRVLAVQASRVPVVGMGGVARHVSSLGRARRSLKREFPVRMSPQRGQKTGTDARLRTADLLITNRLALSKLSALTAPLFGKGLASSDQPKVCAARRFGKGGCAPPLS